MEDLIIIGVGFPDIIQTVEDINSDKKQFNLLGFLDDNTNLHNQKILNYPVLGSLNWIKENQNVKIINTIARDLPKRQVINQYLRSIGCRFTKLIHPSVNIKYSKVENNVLISKFVYLEPRTIIKKDTMILPFCSIGHDVIIEKNCFIASGCHFGGFSNIKENCLIGAGSSIHPKVTIEKNCKIGINSSIFSNIRPNKIVLNKPSVSIN